jgi:hypothetical protein
MNFKDYLQVKVEEGNKVADAAKKSKPEQLKKYTVEIPEDECLMEKIQTLCKEKYETSCSFKKAGDKKIITVAKLMDEAETKAMVMDIENQNNIKVESFKATIDKDKPMIVIECPCADKEKDDKKEKKAPKKAAKKPEKKAAKKEEKKPEKKEDKKTDKKEEKKDSKKKQ